MTTFVRRIVTFSLLFGGLSQLGFSTTDKNRSKTIFLPVDKIFSVEHGFDTTDTIEIAIKGFMPDSCHTLGQGSARVDEVNKKIYINIKGYVKQNEMCWMAVTPYLEIIQLGQLSEGNYEVHSVKSPAVVGKLHINKSATDRRDDHLYAPVDTVELSASKSEHTSLVPFQELTLKGTYPYMLKGCMRVVNVKTYKTKNDVLVVLPISKVLEGDACTAHDVDEHNRFNISQKIHSTIEKIGLLHVRTLNGRALNKLVDFSKGE